MGETTIKERPILFSGPMIRALLDGRKTQTRRMVKPQPDPSWGATSAGVISSDSASDGEWSWLSGDPRDADTWGVHGNPFRCPYGSPGDRLFVRESIYVQPEIWAAHRWPQPFHYAADVPREQVEDYVLKPSIHMPRWASRITLEITGVRVERVQEISEADAVAEGAERNALPGTEHHWSPEDGYRTNCVHYPEGCECFPHETAREWFRELWAKINGAESWDADPYVWVVEFKRVEVTNGA